MLKASEQKREMFFSILLTFTVILGGGSDSEMQLLCEVKDRPQVNFAFEIDLKPETVRNLKDLEDEATIEINPAKFLINKSNCKVSINRVDGLGVGDCKRNEEDNVSIPLMCKEIKGMKF